MNLAHHLTSGAHTVCRLIGLAAPADTESSLNLFRGIRWRLILWYSGVLTVILLLSSVVLYLSMRQSLLGPIDQSLQENAQVLSQHWQTLSAQFPGPLPVCAMRHFAPPDWLYVCYDVDGHVIGESDFVANGAPHISTPSLVRAAIHDGKAKDTEETASPLGTVERYALKVPTPDGRGVLGVIQVATPIGTQLQDLDTLLYRLLLLNVLTLVLAAIGGFFLANRALLPARLAHRRQREFIADAAHELRTPLTLLRTDADVLLRRRERLAPDDVELLEDIVTETAHMAALANHLLDLARLDADEARLEQEVIDLTELAAKIVHRVQPLAEERSLMLKLEYQEPILVVGDRLLLTEAILVLLDNAIKYNQPSGQVLVRVESKNQQAQLEVQDTGIGIPPEHLPHLGERFYRVDKARSRETGGAGLGISIAQRIAARHGGSLRLTSELGGGTTATLTLPAARMRESTTTRR
jgi:signal transduction histidine kinase